VNARLVSAKLANTFFSAVAQDMYPPPGGDGVWGIEFVVDQREMFDADAGGRMRIGSLAYQVWCALIKSGVCSEADVADALQNGVLPQRFHEWVRMAWAIEIFHDRSDYLREMLLGVAGVGEQQGQGRFSEIKWDAKLLQNIPLQSQ
jgi:hypothetical protein